MNEQELKDAKLEAWESLGKYITTYTISHTELKSRIDSILAMHTKVEARYFRRPLNFDRRLNPNGRVEALVPDSGAWLPSTTTGEQLLDGSWNEYFPDAEENNIAAISSRTPRTEEQVAANIAPTKSFVHADFARSLEMELNTSNEELRYYIGRSSKFADELNKAVAERKDDYVFGGPKEKAEIAEVKAMYAHVSESKPYLPLPEEGLVVLPENPILPDGKFEGWAVCPTNEKDTWSKGLWAGISGIVYAVSRSSEVARLNWEAILNAELAELGLPKCPPVPNGFDRWEYRGEEWLSEGEATAAHTRSGEWLVHSHHPTYGVKSHYLEAVKDEPTGDKGLADATDSPRKKEAIERLLSEAPNRDKLRDLIRAELETGPFGHQPTERQEMAKDILCALISANMLTDHSTDKLRTVAVAQTDLIMGREDGK